MGPDTTAAQKSRADTPPKGNAAAHVGRSRPWKLSKGALLVAILGVAGLFVFMYPRTAAWWSSYNQSQVLDANSAVVNENRDPGNTEQIAQAHRYNALLNTGEITLGAGERKPTAEVAGETGALDYDALLAGRDGLMARIKIPSIDVDLPVYHGTSDEVLAEGAGHLQGTSLPVGGPGTHSAISAHRGLATATMFNDLDQLDVGDTFVIEVLDEVLTYRVIETQVVEPDDTQTVLPRAGEDLVTLVTCTPLGINTHRILVTGKRVTPTPIGDLEAAGASPDVPGFPWWAIILPAGVLLAGVYVWRSGYPR